MAKSKLREEQEEPMAVVTMRMPLALERYYRKVGNGNASEGARLIGEEHMHDHPERRYGAQDRRRKKGKK